MNGNRQSKTMTLLAGIGLGVALTFFLDPRRGARRRAIVRARTGRALREGRRELQRRAEDVRNRAGGALAELRVRRRGEFVTDEQLVARVRAELGHHVAHAAAIAVAARDGTVTLSGQAPRDEVDDVLETVRGVRGVEQVRNALDVRDSPGD